MTMRNINHRQAENQPLQQMPRYATAPTMSEDRPHLQLEMPTEEGRLFVVHVEFSKNIQLN